MAALRVEAWEVAIVLQPDRRWGFQGVLVHVCCLFRFLLFLDYFVYRVLERFKLSSLFPEHGFLDQIRLQLNFPGLFLAE